MLKPLKYLALSALTLLMGVNSAFAVDVPAEFHGRLNLSFDQVDPGEDDWVSNASRLGVKGQYSFSDSLSVIYQFEQQVNVARGGTSIDTLFSPRNTFIGVGSKFGQILFGTHDTPFKKLQNKVDPFNDQIGDIKVLLPGEIRSRDSWLYRSPEFGSGFKFKAMYVPSDSNFNSSQSVSLTYESGNLYLGLAADSDMRKNAREVSRTSVYDSARGVLQYSVGNWTFGGVLQSSRQVNEIAADSESGYSVSAVYKVHNFTLIGQYGQSDILSEDASSFVLGVAYKLARNTKVYVYYQDLDDDVDSETVSVGFEFKFDRPARVILPARVNLNEVKDLAQN